MLCLLQSDKKELIRAERVNFCSSHCFRFHYIFSREWHVFEFWIPIYLYRYHYISLHEILRQKSHRKIERTYLFPSFQNRVEKYDAAWSAFYFSVRFKELRHFKLCFNLKQYTLISLINVGSTLTDFEKFHPPRLIEIWEQTIIISGRDIANQVTLENR